MCQDACVEHVVTRLSADRTVNRIVVANVRSPEAKESKEDQLKSPLEAFGSHPFVDGSSMILTEGVYERQRPKKIRSHPLDSALFLWSKVFDCK
jgi:hypothetical protein